LVAGATGYLGGFVVRELKRRGHFVRALARSPQKLEYLQGSVDEVVKGDVTRPETLDAACRDIDVVFSSVGITRQRDGLTFRDVDFHGNLNLLAAACRVDIVAAHEDFVDVLEVSGIDHAVVRPTGFFSDMGQILEMARKGRVWLIGSGENRVNPIHGADLASACVDAIEGDRSEVDVGGPQTMPWSEVAALAFEAVEKPVRISRIPGWLMWCVVSLVRVFNRHQGELLAFFTTMATTDVVAPATGTRTLGAHYRAMRG
jgi:uncharacterized protein YbjT (DUF2867 family)